MECMRARGALWPPDQPRLARQEVLEARRHVEECAECRVYFEQDRLLLDAYGSLGATSAPLTVREKVFDALAQARWEDLGGVAPASGRGRMARRWGRRTAWTALLVAAVAAVALGPSWLRSVPGAAGPGAGSGGVFVEDYLRRAVGQDHIVTHDPEEVVRFLARELGMQLLPIDLEGLVLESAEICLLEGRRGAMIVYKKDGAAVAHYMVPREGTVPRRPSLIPRRGEGEMPVVTWSSPAVEQALVGELSPDVLMSIARSSSSD